MLRSMSAVTTTTNLGEQEQVLLNVAIASVGPLYTVKENVYYKVYIGGSNEPLVIKNPKKNMKKIKDDRENLIKRWADD